MSPIIHSKIINSELKKSSKYTDKNLKYLIASYWTIRWQRFKDYTKLGHLVTSSLLGVCFRTVNIVSNWPLHEIFTIVKYIELCHITWSYFIHSPDLAWKAVLIYRIWCDNHTHKWITNSHAVPTVVWWQCGWNIAIVGNINNYKMT